MNRSEFIAELAARLETDKADAKGILATFEELVVDTVSEGEPVTLSGFVKFARKDTPAKPKRKGRNPATGEEMTFQAKPASVKVAVTPLKAFKDTVLDAAKKAKRRR